MLEGFLEKLAQEKNLTGILEVFLKKKTLKRWIAEKIFEVFHKGAPEKVYTVTLCLAPGWIPKQILSQTPFLQEENNSLCGLCGAR